MNAGGRGVLYGQAFENSLKRKGARIDVPLDRIAENERRRLAPLQAMKAVTLLSGLRW